MSLKKLESLAGEMSKCFRCSLCKMVPLPTVTDTRYSDGCPAAREYHFHGYSGSGMSIMALSLVEGRSEVDTDLSDIVFACTACGLCDVACKFIMEAERQDVNLALREHIVEQGFDQPAHRPMITNLEQQGRPRGNVDDALSSWPAALGIKTTEDTDTPVLLFTGCGEESGGDGTGTAKKLAQLLKHAGVNFSVLEDRGQCCGLPAYLTGHREIFTKTADSMVEVLNASSAQTIVTLSGSCLGTMRAKYPTYASAPDARVVHATEFLSELISAGKLSLPKAITRRVTYHDPCHLGRQSEAPLHWEGEIRTSHGPMKHAVPTKEINRGINGVYDAPRQILSAIRGLDFTEMFRIREYAYCCGGGGGVPEAFPELAHSAATHRLEEAADVGAQCLVTACHHCVENLARVQEPAEREALTVIDIIDLVYEAAGLEA